MRRSVDPRLADVEVKQVSMSLDQQGRKFPAIGDEERLAGQTLGSAIHHARSSQQALAESLGHAKQNKVSGWVAGNELPVLFVRLVNDPDLRRGLIVALAEIPGDDVKAGLRIDIPIKKSRMA